MIEEIENILVWYHERERKIYDVELMEELCFSPQSWKTWKTQILQKFIHSKTIIKKEDGFHWYQITYDKKSRLWRANPIENPIGQKAQELENN